MVPSSDLDVDPLPQAVPNPAHRPTDPPHRHVSYAQGLGCSLLTERLQGPSLTGIRSPGDFGDTGLCARQLTNGLCSGVHRLHT
jgi:hypothetical protein